MFPAEQLRASITTILFQYTELQRLTDRAQEDLRELEHNQLEVVLELHHILGDLQLPLQDLQNLLALLPAQNGEPAV